MSGRRPLFRSPWFGDGMTSEAIEESGLNVFMLALAPGIARTRGGAEGMPSGLDIGGGIGGFQSGARHWQGINDSRVNRHYSPVVRSAQSQSSQGLVFFPDMGGKPHRICGQKTRQ